MNSIFQSNGESRSIKIVHKCGDAYELNKKALKKLLVEDKRMNDRFIVSISIVGAMRTGKSYILGIFLRYLRARYQKHDLVDWLHSQDGPNETFEFKNGIDERNTDGIHIWKEVFFYDSPNGEKFAILLIDTQGVFDQQSSTKDNNVIFASSSLMSSVQIFNVKSNINEDDYQHLQQFAAFGKVAASDTGKAPFQKLIFLVRDSSPVQQKLGLEGGQLLLDKRSSVANEHQLGRDQIKAAYQLIECFLMVHPGFEVTEEPDYDGSIQVVRPKFKEQIEDLIPHILAPENLIAKEINGRKIRPMEFINYLDTFISFFNSKASPSPENFMAANAKANNLNAVMVGFENYMKWFREIDQSIYSLADFDKLNQDILKGIFDEFDSKTKFGGTELSKEYRDKLESNINQLYQPFREKIEKKLRKDGQVDSEFINETFDGPLMRLIKYISSGIQEAFKTIGTVFATTLVDTAFATTLVDGIKKAFS